MPASSARNCSSRSRNSSGEGGSVTKRSKRGAAIGVKSDVMIERPVAVRRGRAGEIERAQSGWRDRRAHDLHHVGIGPLLGLGDLRREGGDIDRRIGERPSAARNASGSSVGRSPCTLTTILARALRIDRAKRLENAIRAGDMVGPRHDGAAAGRRRPLRRCSVVGCDHDRPEPGGLGPAQHMHDHRQRQRCRRAACRAGGSRPCGPESGSGRRQPSSQ